MEPFGQTPAAHHRLLIAELQAVADGLVDRLMVLMPPGSAKSMYATRLFAPWLLSRKRGMKLLGASHTGELADDFSGKIQDHIRENEATLGYGLRTKAAGRWKTTNGGEYLAAGVRSGIPGFRAQGVCIDDPVKGRAAADSPADRKQVWDWYNGDLERRLTPRAFIVLVMCMVGNTRVLMADGTHTQLKDIRPGDHIATYDAGILGTSVVEDWKSQGIDDVFEIQTISGGATRANARHPFLVDRNGTRSWVRLRDLRIGEVILRVTQAERGGEHGRRAHLADGRVATNWREPKAIVTARMRRLCSERRNTSGFTLDRVTAIVAVGRDEVFDLRVARTRNFIADGFVSHNTPWHEADLAGELLRTEPERWRVVRLPAEAEAGDMLGRAPGEWLWSDGDYGYGAELSGIKAALSARGAGREWSSQYQGRPVPDTGDYFQRQWLIPVPTLPPRSALRIFGASDYAVTSGDGDWTVHIVVGIDSDDRLYVCDVWRQQTSSDVWVEAFCDLVLLWKPMGWAEEMGQIKAAMGPLIDKRSRERRAYVARTAFPTRGDKSIRAQSFRGRAALNGLHIPQDAPWRAEFEAELLSFPAGRHDDQVDAGGLVGQLLDVMMPPPGEKPPPPPRDSWDRSFNRNQDDDPDGWKVA